MTQTRSVPLRPDFPGLDWLRAVGALAVLTTHVAFQTGEYFRHGTLGTLLARLDVGVALFFVLSGFLLSRDWWVRHELGLEPQRTRRYALKRALRILPVYVVTVNGLNYWTFHDDVYSDSDGLVAEQLYAVLVGLDTSHRAAVSA